MQLRLLANQEVGTSTAGMHSANVLTTWTTSQLQRTAWNANARKWKCFCPRRGLTRHLPTISTPANQQGYQTTNHLPTTLRGTTWQGRTTLFCSSDSRRKQLQRVCIDYACVLTSHLQSYKCSEPVHDKTKLLKCSLEASNALMIVAATSKH